MIYAQSGLGHPKIPDEMAGIEIDLQPSLFAATNEL
jgi:hypothetical protein